jgi:hypothetical protein
MTAVFLNSWKEFGLNKFPLCIPRKDGREGEWRGRGGGEMKNTIVREAITIRTC